MVIKFDLSSIPSNSAVSDAVFEIYKYDDQTLGSYSASYNAYVVTREWSDKEANWKKSTASTSWSSPGGDYTASAPCDKFAYNGSYNGWFDYSVKKAVQGFIDTPSENHGFIVLVPEQIGWDLDQGSFFYSSESSKTNLRPKLTITYDGTTQSTGQAAKGVRKRITIQRMAHTLVLRVPFMEGYSVTMSDLRGRKITSCMDKNGSESCVIPLPLSSGVYVITVRTSEETLVEKFRF